MAAKPRKRTREELKQSVFGKYTKRQREPGEALGVQVPPMRQPRYKPPAWVAPIR